jgi:hypothetical protein
VLQEKTRPGSFLRGVFFRASLSKLDNASERIVIELVVERIRGMISKFDSTRALALFERLLSPRNDVGLLAEEYDPHARRRV